MGNLQLDSMNGVSLLATVDKVIHLPRVLVAETAPFRILDMLGKYRIVTALPSQDKQRDFDTCCLCLFGAM
jgi:hypothetical protein